MRICVLGAGIAGLAAAYTLHGAGHQVCVIDQGPHAAGGASAGNGAQLSYAYVQPLADPAIWGQLPKLLLASDSPLKFRLQADPQQWAWGLAFLSACNAATSQQSTRELLTLAAISRAAFEAMLCDLQPDCDHSTPGKLVLYPNPASLDAAARQVRLQASLGGPAQQVISRSECIQIEPALSRYQGPLAGAVYTASESAADCLKVCRALSQALHERGVEFQYGAGIEHLDQAGNSVRAVHTDRGIFRADHFVLALGSGSQRLCASMGLRLPVYPLKGYSITLDVGHAADAAPTVSVTDSARKVVFARLGQRLRVAGMVELVGYGLGIPDDRIATLRHAAEQVFPGCSDFKDLRPWAGLRPATPTGLPITGRLAGGPANLWLHTGHGALGFTLAFGTAQNLARAMQA